MRTTRGPTMRQPHRLRTIRVLIAAITVLAGAPLSSAHAWTYNVIYSFCGVANCANGASPQGDLLRDASGNLYGTAGQGGAAGGGAVFRLSRNGDSWTEDVLYSFCSKANCADGVA